MTHALHTAIMPRMRKRDTRHGAAAFETFYHDLYGDRWEGLRACLSRESGGHQPEAVSSGRPIELREGLKRSYYLDEASFLAAEALDVQPGDSVLDLCAAPGGKSLILALHSGTEGTLVANERSATRRARLLRVLDTHLPPEIRSRIRVTGHDARRWGLYETDRYDRVLLDAPCSSEAHVLASPNHLAEWSPSRTRNLATQAHAMLAAAVDAARPGGIILYSTCSVSPAENDEVVERLLKKRSGVVEVLSRSAPWGEQSKHGWQIFPDRSEGRGPIYYAILRKLKPSL